MSLIQPKSDAFAEPAPQPLRFPAFALWLFERGLTNREASRRLGRVSYETIRRICLPFGDPGRWEPSEGLAQRIDAWTNGAVPPASFKAPVP